MRWVVLVVVVIGVVALRREEHTTVAAAPVAAPRVIERAPPPPPPRLLERAEEDPVLDDDFEEEEIVEEEEIAEEDGVEVDVMQFLARVGELETGLQKNGALHGLVRDHRDGEPLAGVTIVAYRPNIEQQHYQVALTDENGFYVLTNLEPGTYTVTMYYVDHVTEFPEVEVSRQRVAPLYARIDTTPMEREYIYEPDDHGVSFSGTTSIDNHYIIVE